jgi:hypothetical protein
LPAPANVTPPDKPRLMFVVSNVVVPVRAEIVPLVTLMFCSEAPALKVRPASNSNASPLSMFRVLVLPKPLSVLIRTVPPARSKLDKALSCLRINVPVPDFVND